MGAHDCYMCHEPQAVGSDYCFGCHIGLGYGTTGLKLTKRQLLWLIFCRLRGRKPEDVGVPLGISGERHGHRRRKA